MTHHHNNIDWERGRVGTRNNKCVKRSLLVDVVLWQPVWGALPRKGAAVHSDNSDSDAANTISQRAPCSSASSGNVPKTQPEALHYWDDEEVSRAPQHLAHPSPTATP